MADVQYLKQNISISTKALATVNAIINRYFESHHSLSHLDLIRTVSEIENKLGLRTKNPNIKKFLAESDSIDEIIRQLELNDFIIRVKDVYLLFYKLPNAHEMNFKKTDKSLFIWKIAHGLSKNIHSDEICIGDIISYFEDILRQDPTNILAWREASRILLKTTRNYEGHVYDAIADACDFLANGKISQFNQVYRDIIDNNPWMFESWPGLVNLFNKESTSHSRNSNSVLFHGVELDKSERDAMVDLECLIGEWILPTDFAVDFTDLNSKYPYSVEPVKSAIDYHSESKLYTLAFEANNGHVIKLWITRFQRIFDTNINRSFFQLSELPESIGNLTHLERLYLEKNNIAFLPESIGNLIKLEVLDISYNKIADIPATIENLRALKILDALSNELSYLPSSFGNLPSFYELDITINNFIALSEEITRVTTLRILRIGWKNLTEFPKEFFNLANLEELSIDGSTLSTLPDEFGNLTNLIIFTAPCCNLSSIPNSIGNLQSLKILFLNDNKLTELPETFENLQSLEEIVLSNNNFLMFPEILTHITSLQNLSIMGNYISSIPETIENLVYLKQLSLRDNPITTLPKEINKLPELDKNCFSFLSEGEKKNKQLPAKSAISELQKIFGNKVTNAVLDSDLLAGENLKSVLSSLSYDDRMDHLHALCSNWDKNVQINLAIEINKFISEEPLNSDYWLYLGKIIQEAGNNEQAINAYQYALALMPENYVAWINLGRALFNSGDFLGAVMADRRAIELNQDYAPLWNNLSQDLVFARCIYDAIKAAEKATFLTPANATFWTTLGEAIEASGDKQGAADKYRNALILDPKEKYAQEHLDKLEALIASKS